MEGQSLLINGNLSQILNKLFLKTIINKIAGYSHKLVEDRHSKKVSHFITLYFLHEVTAQDFCTIAVPFLFNKRKTGKMLIVAHSE